MNNYKESHDKDICIVLSPGNNQKFWNYTSFMLHQLKRFKVNIIITEITSECTIPDEYKKEWVQYENTSIIDVSDIMSSVGIGQRIKSNFSRYAVSRLIVPLIENVLKYDNVLYLDTDILILNDFTGIFEIDLGEYLFGASIDYIVQFGFKHDYINQLHDKYEKLGIERHNNKFYFNSGVLLYNMPKLRQHLDEYVEKLRFLNTVYYKYPWDWCDQDTLNLGFDICQIPQIYNKQFYFSPKTKDDIFLHFTTGDKKVFDNILQKYTETVIKSKNNYKTALVAIAKDEDNYLKEWVDYHLKLGFDDIYIYQNDWKYSRQDITDTRVHFLEISGAGKQVECYNGFMKDYSSEYGFAAFFDIDEFLYIKNKLGLKNLLERFTDKPAVFINWRIFGDNGLSGVSDNNYSVLKRFTKCSTTLDPLGKNIINLNIDVIRKNLTFHNPHILLYKGREFRVGDPTSERHTVCGCIYNNSLDEPCELYHYRNKTWEEYVDRRYMKQDVMYVGKTKAHYDIESMKSYFRDYNKNEIYNNNMNEGNMTI